MPSRITEHAFQPFHFHRKHIASQPLEPVVAPSRVIRRRSRRGFLDKALKHQSFQVVVKRARSELVLPFQLTSNSLHDSVPMKTSPTKPDRKWTGCWGGMEDMALA